MVDFRLPADIEGIRARVALFVDREVLPNESAGLDEHGEVVPKLVEALRAKARGAGLFLPHMPKERGGLGLGPLGMAMVSQELGRSPLAPLALNCSAPDEGNMLTLLSFGTAEQQKRFLTPLAEGRHRSCFAMTEKVAGADPSGIRTTATPDGDGWRLDGEKWFITGADGAAFAIVVARTGERFSLFLVDGKDPGWKVLRRVPVMGTHAPGGHCEVRLDGARGELLGAEGRGLEHAQARLAGGRIAHAMRWIGVMQRSLDLAAKRALERSAFGGPLAEKQAIQRMLSDSATDLYVSRLMVLHAAWKLEVGEDSRQQIAMLKVFVANALHRVVDRAIQVHGALGVSDDLPLARFYRDARAARIYDGPDEVHEMAVARRLLKVFQETGTTQGATGLP
ncbi:MAG: acyl-CoA dehydrogenase family protein [Methanobacteriota archaeon]